MVTVDMAGTLEATAITGLAMANSGMAILATVFLAIIIIIIIAISSLTTAAGNGAPTARSTSAPAIIDSKRRKRISPGPRGSGEFLDSLMIAVIVCPSPPTNLVAGSSAGRTAEMNLLVASRLSLLRQMHSRRLG
jgi:hypothetical protein